VLHVSAAVVVPLYRASLDETERIALTQCCRVLGRHAIVFIAPEGLDIARACDVAAATGVTPRVERFDRAWFRSTETYSALLLARSFYERFAGWDFILIHQLDAFVFADALERFCALGYDYIGAPWSHDRVGRRIVGNGGFSLRRVAAALRVLDLPSSKVSERLALWWRRHAILRRPITDWLYRTGRLDRNLQSDNVLSLAATHLLYVNEDGFWGQNCDKLPFFTTAPYHDALAFSFETDPQTALERNGGALPFGCHAWPYLEPEFWQPHIEASGYEWKREP
jgi:hypothetical protein